MKINLKKYVDEKKVTLEVVAKETGVELEMLLEMYNKGTFDSAKLGVNGLTNLLMYFEITNVNNLIPEIR
ncbi:hypothetical protein [Enterococcus rivorum]|uniref:HTH cro/C1-type domain-containing protein n=1 Tax=Enterococcus rivorum TaxID=762845 RepID=A0A1E5L088_9ENTE|nr:hypothetical protein [Enterococcus rivorum]MBP2098853.1 hypothetical protein [Enterococcus rivorum]OEH83582.1 hypothetical protein BCR26_08880 [Enterococcus rivorum]